MASGAIIANVPAETLAGVSVAFNYLKGGASWFIGFFVAGAVIMWAVHQVVYRPDGEPQPVRLSGAGGGVPLSGLGGGGAKAMSAGSAIRRHPTANRERAYQWDDGDAYPANRALQDGHGRLMSGGESRALGGGVLNASQGEDGVYRVDE